MTVRGFEFYDNDDNLRNYLQLRQWNENANDTLEKPVIMEMIGEVAGRDVLDLGCGDCRFGAELLAQGCASYTGVEGSANMIQLAKQQLDDSRQATIVHAGLEEWPFPAERFDLVTARLVLHYIEDVESIFERVCSALRPNGVFVFSVEHPVLTSSFGSFKPEGQKTSWMVDRYFSIGPRRQEWLGGTAVKYHRTIEDYFAALQNAGLAVEQLREARPQRQCFINQETYERRLRIPLFLLMAGRKKCEN